MLSSDNRRQLVVQDDPKSVGSEAFRTLRTNLQFVNPDARPDTILITSAGPAEGKSTVSANLAVSMAQTGKKVIYVDCDLRKPVGHKIFGLHNSVGVTSVLTGQATLDEALQKSQTEGLWVLTAGPLPPNPADLLQSQAMKHLIDEIKSKSDQRILDSAPVLPVADAMIIAPQTDGVVLVVAANSVPRQYVIRAKELLENTGVKILGVVLNGVKYTNDREHYYYTYYSSSSVGK